ncbi:colanic acid biosynthesis glycosyltransferase WcaL [Bacteroidales bacterium Barb6]|nr:colanic acid biosynthesis glycosyltransferase WcaL [Bacteroidales bacterium Barb6]
MKVYFYHAISIEKNYRAWKISEFPGHLLYGLTHLYKYGIESIYHTIPFNPYQCRLRLMLYNLKSILFCKESFDAVYAATHYGLELLIFLRACGLYKKPIVIWHHTAIVTPSNSIRRLFSKLFYKGIDKVCFFSQPLLENSLKTCKVKKENAFLIHWGADLTFFDTLRSLKHRGKQYISTGRERRDFITLIRAFNKTTEQCDIYVPVGYEIQLAQELKNNAKNIQLSFVEATHIEMAKIANNAFVIMISCFDYPYTVGLTSLVEAMALGRPIITTANPNFPIDVEKENIGIKIPHGDVDAWVKAIQYLSSHPDEAKTMGDNARSLAERQYNLELFTKEIASILLSINN